MNRYLKLLMLATASLSTAALAAASAPHTNKAEQPPNIIVIMADDLGYGDLSSYGSTAHYTPHIDALAGQGLRSTAFYVTSPVCTPSRVALLTARHPVRVGFSTLLWPTTEGGLPQEERTMAEILQERGYATGLVGKWHLGHSDESYLPLAHGFDYFYGMPYPNDMGPDHVQTIARGETWPPMPMLRGTELVESGIDVNLLTQQYTAEALAFIAREHHQPFFLFLSHAMPHTIVGASPDFKGRSKNGLYGDAVQELDWSVGEVMRTLRAFGLEENTLVIFTSDNGAVLPEQFADKQAYAKTMFPDLTYGTNGPLRGGKQSTFEGGVRLPGIFHWPGVIPAGQVNATPMSVADIMPTALDFAAVPMPDDRDYDGVSLRSELEQPGSEPELADRSLFFGSGSVTSMRSGDWKLVLPSQPNFIAGVSESPMLFNLKDDIGEAHDLAQAQPERMQAMLAELEDWETEALADPVSRPAKP